MPSAAVESAFRERLEANWDTADGVIIGSNGVTEPPADGSAFLLIQYPVVMNTRPMLTTKRFEEGAARILYNAEAGLGLQGPLTTADAIASIFRGDRLKIGSSLNVEIFEPSAPIVSDDNEEGNYFVLAVIVRYRYQFDVVGDSPP
jgi:hypothetical protein